MAMRAELGVEFDCRATAALLDTGGSLAMAGHVAALVTLLSAGGGSWIQLCSAVMWCAIVYGAVRVKMDCGFFALLASHPAEQLDSWLEATNLRKAGPSRTIADRRHGALRLWRGLVAAVVFEMLLMLAAVGRLTS
jgi:hypothetical protein